MRSRYPRDRSGYRQVNRSTPSRPPGPESYALSLEGLLEAHKDLYRTESEKRLIAWLRQDLLAMLEGTSPGLADVGRNANAPALAPPAAGPADRRLTADEAAARLKFTKKTLANWRSNKEGPDFVRFRNSIYYMESAIDAWEQAQIEEGNR
jgi:predicted DNA-binding transcriptional regulator AlpA